MNCLTSYKTTKILDQKTMNQNMSSNSSSLDKKIHPEQFDRVVEAILAGKYSWACVLMLRIAGYNPLHYIPYRTYNRLLKENSQVNKANKQQSENPKVTNISSDKRSDEKVASGCLSKIKDLAYLEVVGKQNAEVRGGNLNQCLTSQTQTHESMQHDLNSQDIQDFSLKFCEIT